MRRRLFTIAAALSLLMLATVVVLWVRSHWSLDMVGSFKKFPTGFEDRVLWSGEGRLGFTHLYTEYTGPTAAQNWALDPFSKRPMGRYVAAGAPTSFNRNETLGFHLRRSQVFAAGPATLAWRTSLHVPYWFLSLLFGALPALWAWRRWRKRDVRGFDVEPGTVTEPAASSESP